MTRQGEVVEWRPSVTRDFGDLAGVTGTAEASDIGGDSMPDETALHVRHGGVGPLLGEPMDAGKDPGNPGPWNERPRNSRRDVAEQRSPRR